MPRQEHWRGRTLTSLDAAWLQNTLFRLYNLGEAVAGSQSEKALVEAIASMVEDVLGVSPRLVPVPVTLWSLEHVEVKACGRSVNALVLPPTTSVSMDAKVGSDILVLEFNVEEPDGFLPKLWRTAGRRLAVLVDRLPRRVVVPPRPPLPDGIYHRVVSPAAIAVDRRGYSLVRGCGRLRVEVEAYLRQSTGYIVEAVEEDAEAVFAAHHDHWLGGASDDLVGVLQALVAGSRLQRRGVKVGFISFTAEEFGASPLRDWYWAWGSRIYSRYLKLLAGFKGVLVVFDTAVSDAVAVGSPIAGLCMEAAGGPPYIGRDDVDTDSFWLSSLGLASLAVVPARLPDYYHSPADTPEKVNAGEAFSIAVRVSDALPRLRLEACVREYFSRVLAKASRLPLPRMRQELYRVYQLSHRQGVEAALAAQAALSVPVEAVDKERWCLCLDEVPRLPSDWLPRQGCPRLLVYGEKVVDHCTPGVEVIPSESAAWEALDALLAERLSSLFDGLHV